VWAISWNDDVIISINWSRFNGESMVNQTDPAWHPRARKGRATFPPSKDDGPVATPKAPGPFVLRRTQIWMAPLPCASPRLAARLGLC